MPRLDSSFRTFPDRVSEVDCRLTQIVLGTQIAGLGVDVRAPRLEQLEQLRWLENGWKIRVAEVEHDAISVDVPEDVARVEKLLQK